MPTGIDWAEIGAVHVLAAVGLCVLGGVVVAILQRLGRRRRWTRVIAGVPLISGEDCYVKVHFAHPLVGTWTAAEVELQDHEPDWETSREIAILVHPRVPERRPIADVWWTPTYTLWTGIGVSVFIVILLWTLLG